MVEPKHLTRTRIFVSYSHKDAKWVGDGSLLGSLRGLEHEGADFWWDKRLTAGEIWDDEIQKHLLAAHLVLVLVSQWLLDSQYIRNVEVRSMLARVRSGGLTIFPVIVSACEWNRFSWLEKLQHLPEGDKTLADHYNRPGLRERMFKLIREQLRSKLVTKDPAELAVQAMSGAVNVINSIEPEYRAAASGNSEQHPEHGLHFTGLGNEVQVTRNGTLEKTITAGDLRHLSFGDLESIIERQQEMRTHYERWRALYQQRGTAEGATELKRCATELKPRLLELIGKLKSFGLDLEDHYERFAYFLATSAAI